MPLTRGRLQCPGYYRAENGTLKLLDKNSYNQWLKKDKKNQKKQCKTLDKFIKSTFKKYKKVNSLKMYNLFYKQVIHLFLNTKGDFI